jgi:hypothetical protein
LENPIHRRTLRQRHSIFATLRAANVHSHKSKVHCPTSTFLSLCTFFFFLPLPPFPPISLFTDPASPPSCSPCLLTFLMDRPCRSFSAANARQFADWPVCGQHWFDVGNASRVALRHSRRPSHASPVLPGWRLQNGHVWKMAPWPLPGEANTYWQGLPGTQVSRFPWPTLAIFGPTRPPTSTISSPHPT